MSDYENFLALAQSRRSVRRFTDRKVSREDILRVLEAARWAPSNHNRQPWRFIVLEGKAQIVELAGKVRAGLSVKLKALPAIAAGYAGELEGYATCFAGAPCVVLALHKLPVSVSRELLAGVGEPAMVSGEPLSVAMAVQNMLLAAHALGMGACVLTAPLLVEDLVLSEFKMPTGCRPTCLIALGYPDTTPPPPRRKSIDQIVEFRKDSCELEQTNHERN